MNLQICKVTLTLIFLIFNFQLYPHFSINNTLINTSGMTVESRFRTPEGFERTVVKENSFANYLRKLPLKQDGSKVLLFDGRTKASDVHAAVVDMEIGKRDLQQYADACIRLRSEYLFREKRFSDIHYNFTNGWRADYQNWVEGNRIIVEGNKCYWKKKTSPDKSYTSFREYLDIVFAYAGTLSLSKELVSVSPKDINIGDVFIQGGSPGHAVIVVDMAENRKTREKIFLIAQSYMPAQEIHVLKNDNESNSPWYTLPIDSEFLTPEWRFRSNDLKRFRE